MIADVIVAVTGLGPPSWLFPSMSTWISRVPFTSRNNPPAISTRSRHENAYSPMVKIGVVR